MSNEHQFVGGSHPYTVPTDPPVPVGDMSDELADGFGGSVTASLERPACMAEEQRDLWTSFMGLDVVPFQLLTG